MTELFITSPILGVGPDILLPENASLTYETGKMVTVNVDTSNEYDTLPDPLPANVVGIPKVFYDENGKIDYYEITTRAAEDVPEIAGGYVVIANHGGLVLIEVDTAPATSDLLHNALILKDAAFGRCDKADSAALENTFALPPGALAHSRIGVPNVEE